MNWFEMSHYSVYIGLIFFGITYNYFTVRLGSKLRGYTWLWAVIGVGGSILFALPIFEFETAIKIFVVFCCTGAPVIIGCIGRDIIERQKEIEELRKKGDE